ncbi:dnaJ homolog subfamily C member 16-like isoform X2 [Anneissia japonica]|uniref:dnaJ homolog subfamily C member 16-like isoform X2 n=1 Tax=Anneissia japonica TaxID=1529436 RepID=UPI0014256E99|nr:dnaJ homolog subfamily C member 16-like isoform X2 [Anneissia japonica]
MPVYSSIIAKGLHHCGKNDGSPMAVAETSLDPYDVLGVRRTSSLKDIKREYKKLAREWHPDKNDDPEAQQKFIQISQAYEILSDEEKRREYDENGHVDDHQPQRYQQQSFNFGGFSFRFENFGGRGGGGGSRSDNSQRITYPMFHNTILPESHKKAYMLLVTGQWCFNCVRVEEIWEKNAQELKNAGIGIGTVHADYDRRLLRDLGVNSWPSIVGVLDKRIHYFGSQMVINIENLKAFAMKMFPTTHIDKVDDENFQTFLAGHSDNRPRTLLFSRRSVPSLLYLATAYEFRDKMAFGFSSFKSPVHSMCRQYGVDSTRLLVFKEDADNYVDSLEASMLERESIRDVIMDNKYLYAPRLSSQTVFDDLCPVSPSKKNRKVCVILFTQRGKNHDQFRRTFSQVAVDTTFFPDGSRFMYVYKETQRDFTRIIGVEFTQDSRLPVAVVWRRTRNKLNFDWLPGGWKKNDEDDNQRRLRDYLVELSNYISTLRQTREIETMEDENAPHWLTLSVRSIYSTCKAFLRSAIEYISNSILVDVVSVLRSVLLPYNYIMHIYDIISLLSVLMVIIGYMSSIHIWICKLFFNRSKSNVGAPMNEPPRKQHISVYSLDPISNETLVLRAPPGQMTLLILINQANEKELVVEAEKAIKCQIERMEGWHLSCLQVDKYSSWYEQLTNQTLGTQDVKEVVGNILAINGHRMYYCLYNARTQIATYRASHQCSQVSPESVGFGDSDSDTDDENEFLIDNFYAPLPIWIDRLYDGSAKRIQVTEWPTFDPRKEHISVYSLDPISNETLVLRAPPGQMTLLILVNQANEKELVVEAEKAIKCQIERMEGWQLSYLQVDKYSSWYEQLTNQAPGTQDIKEVVGNILAINGHRMYYCLYNARTQIATYRVSHQYSQVSPESVGFGDSDSDTDDGNKFPIDNFYAPLPIWIDRLYDGSAVRIQVTEWPTFDPR